MSYCRFSSANWKSDVYVYDGSEGITIHIASFRYVGYIPKLPDINEVTPEEFYEACTKQKKALNKCKQERIDNPLAGTTTYHKTVKSALDELIYLQYEGFFVPGFVINELESYIKE